MINRAIGLAVVFVATLAPLRAAEPVVTWARTHNAAVTKAVADGAGDIYVAGTSSSYGTVDDYLTMSNHRVNRRSIATTGRVITVPAASNVSVHRLSPPSLGA